MRLLPASLFGRMMLILFSGLVFAQILSASLNFAERDRLLLRSSGMQSAQRIADIVKLLDSLGPAEQQRIVTILSVPPQVVRLEAAPRAPHAAALDNPQAAMFSAALHAALGDARPLRVSVRHAAPGARPSGLESGRQDMMGGHGDMAAAMSAAMPGMSDMPAMRSDMASGLMFLTQVQLRDGRWVAFDTQLPQGPASTPWRLLLTLLVLLLTVLVLSYAAVRWMTRPLAVLACAADALGKDINRPPLPETGPTEVRRAAHAFNIMQSSLVRFIQDRARIFAAMSHDLKTPITRMRLRTELLEDADLRQRFDKDLREMEHMVTHTLDFMRGLETPQVARPIDITALLESLQADNQDMQREVLIEGRAVAPYVGDPERLKRCVSNLIDNAVLYGRQARVIVEDSPAALTLRILDQGPGIAPDELGKVFEPFYRLEASRSRETGGTGLGLGIARNIARAAGGDVTLRNHPDGGLEATLHLPRKPGFSEP
jgi:signal transduction histidine kinase